jgi:hypothetical protein
MAEFQRGKAAAQPDNKHTPRWWDAVSLEQPDGKRGGEEFPTRPGRRGRWVSSKTHKKPRSEENGLRSLGIDAEG